MEVDLLIIVISRYKWIILYIYTVDLGGLPKPCNSRYLLVFNFRDQQIDLLDLQWLVFELLDSPSTQRKGP